MVYLTPDVPANTTLTVSIIAFIGIHSYCLQYDAYIVVGTLDQVQETTANLFAILT